MFLLFQHLCKSTPLPQPVVVQTYHSLYCEPLKLLHYGPTIIYIGVRKLKGVCRGLGCARDMTSNTLVNKYKQAEVKCNEAAKNNKPSAFASRSKPVSVLSLQNRPWPPMI